MKGQATDVSLACKFGVIHIKTGVRPWRLCERDDEEREEFVQELHLVVERSWGRLTLIDEDVSVHCVGAAVRCKSTYMVKSPEFVVPRVECLFSPTSEQVLLVWLADERSWNLCVTELPCCDHEVFYLFTFSLTAVWMMWSPESACQQILNLKLCWIILFHIVLQCYQ